MKRKVLPLIIAGISAAAFAGQSMADVQVYGKANVSLNSVDLESKGTDQWELTSNASRIGVKGSIAINDNLKAIYKMEYETAIDDGDNKGQTFTQRNIYGGFQGDWGSLVAGKHDTPLKLSQGKVDRFNDLQIGDIKNLLEGENRASNIVMYSTPNLSGFVVTAAFMPGEGKDNAGSATDPTDNDGLADGTSISITYTNDMFYASLANDSDVEGWDLTRFTGEAKVGDAKIGLILQNGEESIGTVEQDSIILSAEYAIDQIILKAQYGQTNNEDGAMEEDLTQMAVGIDYKLNKAAKVYSYYANVETDEKGASTTDDSVLAVGFEIKF